MSADLPWLASPASSCALLPRGTGQVGRVAADQALGATLGGEQLADFGDEVGRGQCGTISLYANGSEPGLAGFALSARNFEPIGSPRQSSSQTTSLRP